MRPVAASLNDCCAGRQGAVPKSGVRPLQRGRKAGPSGPGGRAGARPRIPLRRQRLRGGANVLRAPVRVGPAPGADGEDGAPDRSDAAAARGHRSRAAAHARGRRQSRIVRADRDHPRRGRVRPLPVPRPRPEPAGLDRAAARGAAGRAVRAGPADGDREDAAQPSPGARSGPQDRQLPEHHPRPARGARGGRRRRHPVGSRGAGDGRDHLQRLLRPARRARDPASFARAAGGRHPRPVHRDRPHAGADPARGAARSGGAGGGGRGVHDQHATRSDAGDEPLITVRVLEGRQQIVFSSNGPLEALARSASGGMETVVAGGGPGRWTLQLLEGSPGAGASWVELEQLRYDDKQGVQRAREEWAAKGIAVRVATVGEAYGIAGHAVDTRRYAILAEGDATEPGARRQAEELRGRFGTRVQIRREIAVRPQARIELRDPRGNSAGIGESAIELRADSGIAVEQVEYGMGYSFHGYETRTYPGRLFATVDASGSLALVAAVGMERLVKGVVPSEIFARAHLEALKAQAVTARGEVLAKIGARHLGDPYLLCAEQHCQVYKGVAAEEASTGAAVDATRGEALFAERNGQSRLVDSVYSAVCGGYTEDNDAVWGGPADPSLRGRPDFDPGAPGMDAFRDGIGEALVSRFVHLNPVPSYCASSGYANPEKVRWQRAFAQREVDQLCAPLGVGTVQVLAVEGRGVSGRARALRVAGSRATARVYGELPNRRRSEEHTSELQSPCNLVCRLLLEKQ